VTSAVPAPARRCAPLLAALCVPIAIVSLERAAAAAPEDPDPSSPDWVDGDLGAIDDGPEVQPFEVETQPEAVDDEETDADGGDADEVTEEDAEPIRPPRVDGPYVGVLAFGTANFASVINLDTPAPLFGGGGFVQAGDAVFPWMSIGLAIGGQTAVTGRQRLNEGALLVELGFIPARRYPLSIRTGFGFGGGAIREQGNPRRFGYGGALFKGSLRYEFFPLAAKRRPDRGGGWAIGPELGWLGATPAAKGQPFVNTILLGVSTSFYFGS
jgi:hypothetical protein